MSPRFFLSNFGGNLTLHMNKDMAALIYDHICCSDERILEKLKETMENQFDLMSAFEMKRAQKFQEKEVETKIP